MRGFLNRVRLLLPLMIAIVPALVHPAGRFITLASTTSTQNSGLFDYLLPAFTRKTGIEVRVIAVGTGQALRLAANGDADVLLVHDKAGEMRFMSDGHGVNRREFMYNDYVIVGPASDPAAVRGLTDAGAAFRRIAAAGANFASRGDDSGTNREELRLWETAGIDTKSATGGWYKEVGAGMGATLNTAVGLQAYTLTDRATWATFRNRGNLELLVDGDPRLFNQYAVIEINPALHPAVKVEEARQFADWLVSAEGQALIGSFTVDGQALFFPNAATPAY
ncbi:MAG: Tungstate-binding protein TupA [Gammaproteobacteria bacterium]|nr:Tungstate-binding protein TupA [Gammaproteobacteria bacterium]